MLYQFKKLHFVLINIYKNGLDLNIILSDTFILKKASPENSQFPKKS